MSALITAVVGSQIVGGLMQADAAGDAADAQAGAAANDIAERRRQFDAIQKLLQPYVQAGSGSPGTFNAQQYLAQNPDVAKDPYWSKNAELHWKTYGQKEGRKDPGMTGATTGALGSQLDLIGLNGADAQRTAIQGLETSPEFAAMQQQGETAILQNASATGGLRGGNTQAALAQFRPQLLAQLINQQYGRLGGITQLGQNSAVGVGNAGLTTANGIGNAMQTAGAAQAGGILGRAAGFTNALGGIAGGIGAFGGLRTPGSSFSPGGTAGSGFGSGAVFGNQDLGVFL